MLTADLDRVPGLHRAAPRGKEFGNARFARNVFEVALAAQALRLQDDAQLDDDDLTTLLPADFAVAEARVGGGASSGTKS